MFFLKMKKNNDFVPRFEGGSSYIYKQIKNNGNQMGKNKTNGS